MLSKALLKATLRALESRLEPATKQRDKYTAEVAEIEAGIAEITSELEKREAA